MVFQMELGTDNRPLLPHNNMHQGNMLPNYSFAPPNMGLNVDKKNYVFVDEHNRHKRLKVMRACEGCRRRKIKCDAATTNQWPCAACLRLKLHCVPPTVNYDRVHQGGNHPSGLERVLDFDNSGGSSDEEYGFQAGAHTFELQNSANHMQVNPANYSAGLVPYNTPPYSDGMMQNDFSYEDLSAMPLPVQQQSFDHTNLNPPQSASLDGSWNGEQYPVTELSDVLGELKIHENGVAPYISQQKKSLAEAPAFEEFEVKLPTMSSGSGASVRIPPELMPSEEQCMEYFDIFFTHVHAYVPVISKPYFYQQWRSNRRSISPLILEAMFACAGRMSEDAAQGAQWLALASKHEDCFMDVPRLSTIQALLLLLKARESAPKRGYYYRSWMTVKKLVTMAHDLELQDHYAQHQAGQDCKSDPTECLIKTRIWQNIFICEIMIGGPQGRTDMGVDINTVDVEIQRPMPGIDKSDYQVSRQFTYLVRKIRNVRIMHDLKGKVKAAPQQEWVSDPKFVNLNDVLDKWLADLPRDLQVTFPDDDTPPWLPSHFVGNMHSYYHLTVIMLHRPQLMNAASYADGSWKRHMAVCYASSKAMCRLQEGILETFGISGLLCMQRGINFVIYAVLTCTMVHLVAIVSPDPAFNSDAKDYFTRHMRILETCTSAWPQPDMQTQIDALRDAFSANTSRPFELKPGFPFASPVIGLQPSPPPDTKYQPVVQRNGSHGHIQQMPFQAAPMTPPVSAGLFDSKDGSIMQQSSNIMSNGPPQLMHSTSMNDSQASWNPTPIFDNWSAAFGEGSASMAAATSSLPQQSPPLYSHSASSSYAPIPSPYPMGQNQQAFPVAQNTPSLSRKQSMPQVPAYTNTTPSFVTSGMWQETVANTYDPLRKRRREDRSSYIDPTTSKRPR